MSDVTSPAAPVAPIAVRRISRHAGALLPGVALCGIVTAAAFGAAAIEVRIVGVAWLEPLVLAILIGTAVRTAWSPGRRWQAGIVYSAKTLLEVAVMLLGAAISFRTLAAVGPALLFGIAGVVAVAIPTSIVICRLLGLPIRMAVLVACGNAICGNSAIAAVAPVIGAACEDVAAAIAFTAVLGVVVVLGLPAVATLLALGPGRAGVLSGLTVYAVPQVIAAAAPMGLAAVQIGTLVKLVRVLMLGPVILALSLLVGRPGRETGVTAVAGSDVDRPVSSRIRLQRIVPWFILAFLALATLHTLGAVPTSWLGPIATVANTLTILSMAALGLGVDIRVVARAGLRVTAAVTLSLVALGAVSLGLIQALGFD